MAVQQTAERAERQEKLVQDMVLRNREGWVLVIAGGCFALYKGESSMLCAAGNIKK